MHINGGQALLEIVGEQVYNVILNDGVKYALVTLLQLNLQFRNIVSYF